MKLLVEMLEPCRGRVYDPCCGINGSMSSNQSGENEIREAMIEADLVDCVPALPGQLFHRTQIPARLWFVARGRKDGMCRGPRGEILFVDARKLGRMVDRSVSPGVWPCQ